MEQTNFPKGTIGDDLLLRVLTEEASAEELERVKQWFEASEANRKHFNQLSILWNTSEASGKFKATYLQDDWKKVSVRIQQLGVEESGTRSKTRSFIPWLVRAAAVLILSVGFYFVIQSIYAPSFEVATTSEVRTVTLEDGTVVYLNANSKLIYPEKFEGNARAVSLEGEAFFEVARNPNKPFRITSGKISTEVLGTSFNINSTEDEALVTVVTGKVRVMNEKNKEILLTPGEQGIYSKDQLRKQLTSDENFLSWKTNVLVFNNTPISKVIDNINRHYHQHIKLESGSLTGCTLSSRYEKQSLEAILSELQLLFALEIERTNKLVIIKGKGC